MSCDLLSFDAFLLRNWLWCADKADQSLHACAKSTVLCRSVTHSSHKNMVDALTYPYNADQYRPNSLLLRSVQTTRTNRRPP
jgi:hypothetical protein